MALITTCLMLGYANRSVAQGYGDRQTIQDSTDPLFVKLDVNHDGYVDRHEADRLKEFIKAFKEADEDGNDRLDPSEFIKAHAIYDRINAYRFVDDTVITVKVKAALLRSPDIEATSISVETRDGKVRLSGFVNDPAQAKKAAEIASGVRGVKAVKNRILVKG